MTPEKQFIEILLSKTKDFEEGLIVPNEAKMKISEIENFNLFIAEKLSFQEVTLLTRSNSLNNEIYRKEDFKIKLLKIDLIEKSISFYPSALRKYLKNLKL